LLPSGVLAAWLLVPPLVYLLIYQFIPSLARNGFGMGMLALDLLLLAWATATLRRSHPLA
jgi:hypothetical protein